MKHPILKAPVFALVVSALTSLLVVNQTAFAQADKPKIKGMFNLRKAREEQWMEKYPNTPEARDYPLQGLENARPETKALGQPRMNGKDLPFNPRDLIKKLKGWEGSEFDQAD